MTIGFGSRQAIPTKGYVRCDTCNDLKSRREDGVYKNGTPRFRDIWGCEWHGMTCPDCIELLKMKKIRQIKAILKQGTPRMSDRMCRKCGKPLPYQYYFYHRYCKPKEFELE